MCSALLIGAQRAKTNIFFFFFLIHEANERRRSKNRINKNGDCTKEIARWASRSLLFSQPAKANIPHTSPFYHPLFYASGSCRVGGNIAICVYVWLCIMLSDLPVHIYFFSPLREASCSTPEGSNGALCNQRRFVRVVQSESLTGFLFNYLHMHRVHL